MSSDTTVTEILAAEISLSASQKMDQKVSAYAKNHEPAAPQEPPSADLKNETDAALERVNEQLDRYTNHADRLMYEVSIASGLIAGAMDALFVGETVVNEKDIAFSHQSVNRFIQDFAKKRGCSAEHLKDSIAFLEKQYKVAQDNVWSGAGIGVSAKDHHLADLAHHPTPAGLAAAIVVQFLRVGIFTTRNGEVHFLPVKTDAEDIRDTIVPVVITGLLNWLVYLGEQSLSDETKEQIPTALRKVAHLLAASPMLIEIAECADNWVGHLVSDMGGSKNTPGGGMGIPGVFISFLYELAGLPGLRDTDLPAAVDSLYKNSKIDLRHELAYVKAAGKQAIPVALNEIVTRTLYFVCMIRRQETEGGVHGINWKQAIPFGNRTVDRMLTISTLTFNITDTTDAAVRAAAASGGNWVLFATKFAARYNYVGAGRAVLAVVREISNEKKEEQLLREKRILTECQTYEAIQALQQYKEQVEERLSQYIAEDTEAFLMGFDYMQQGIAANDSDCFIRGNVVIQRVLGHEVQFRNQQEFDDLMDLDAPLVL